MKVKRAVWGIVMLCTVLGLTACGQSAAPGYQANQTIRTGKLRATTFALVSSAENSSLNYRQQYRYIEDIGDGRGYTAGIIGFTSATGDLRTVVQRYVRLKPYHNRLRKYLPALRRVDGTASHRGLGHHFVSDWRHAAQDSQMRHAQDVEVDRVYLRPVLRAAQKDDLSPLGQYIYYDAMVVHGPGQDANSFGGIRQRALKLARSPKQGGDQATYLKAFLKVRTRVMRQEKAHKDLSRLNVQRQLINEKKYRLNRPLNWKMYGDAYHLK
ncbi:chitosanase [Levilactobacillus enshiensis]|uniref:chitosanase n=1 Tax=Levilactobacillus enshiensis TaxID=2590213 RepID=UPI00131D035C|nr:chitosanase [Levilactobacillus enshiensis]